MTEKQYRNANKLSYIIVMFILLYMGLAFTGAILMGDLRFGVVIQVVVTLMGITIATAGFVKFKGNKTGAILIVLGPTFTYFIAMCFNSTAMTFMYAFPIMFASMVYLNLRMMCIGDALVVLGTFIHILRLYPAGIMSLDFAFVEGMLTVLCVIASILSAYIISGFNKENMASIEEKAKDQLEKAQSMTNAAESLMEHFDNANSYIEKVSECITANNLSMENIAQSTENTAEAVQAQAEMCSEITDNTQNAEGEIKDMLNAAENTLKTVNEGVALIRELKQQSDIVNEASQLTVRNTNELTRKIEEVETITGAILSISGQTNLLALNASIEAARAGEAGKGFAVVADEIRQLSEQTKQSVNKISEIISDLNSYAAQASDSVSETIQSVEKQNEMIDNSQAKFNLIADEVTALSRLVDNTDTVMKEIFKETTVISENIVQLSATSEEVSASSNEGLNTSKEAVAAMNEVQNILVSLNQIAEELKFFASTN